MKYIFLIIICVGVFLFFRSKMRRAKKSIAITDYEDDNYSPTKKSCSLKDDYPKIRQYWESTETVPVTATFNFTYENAKYEESERTINVSEYNGSYLLRGYCFLRNAKRTFRIDRIIECVDEETGEIVKNIPEYLYKRYQKTTHYFTYNHPEIWQGMRILFYVSKADSQLRAPERAIIHSAFQHLTDDKDFSNDEINDVINAIPPLSLQAFKLAVGKLHKINPETLRYVLTRSKEIVNTQKTIHVNEAEALAYIEKKLA